MEVDAQIQIQIQTEWIELDQTLRTRSSLPALPPGLKSAPAPH
jgi:hypothetical protein